MRLSLCFFSALFFLPYAFAPIPSHAGQPSLSLPVACELGSSCFLQSYVDHDPGPGRLDFACGKATYNGHKGTDFRLKSTADVLTSVPVLAAADGRVKGVRDGMVDIFASDGGRAPLKGRECGNGLVIDHGDGWETQYCHLKRGSLRVRPGQSVKRGQHIGSIGYSGLTDFVHLHLSVRHNNDVVDPFLYPMPPGDRSCRSSSYSAQGLWEDSLRGKLGYRDGQLISAGFVTDVVSTHLLEKDETAPSPDRGSAKLLFYVRAINLREGDRIRLGVVGPDGVLARSSTKPIKRPQATYVAYTGKKLTAVRWAAGMYRGVGEVVRDGAVISRMQDKLSIAN